MQSSLSALDPSLRAPGALKVSRSGTSTEGSASWLVTFNSQLGIIPVLAPTALGELRGTGATVYSNFVAGARREEVHFALRVQNEKSLALTTPLSLTSTATEMQLAIIDAFRVAGVTESANLISVLRSPQIGKHVVWIITISEGFRKKTNLWIEKSNHLPAGLNLVLEDLDCAFRNKSVHTHVLLKSARKPPVVREQQIIRCSLHQFVTDGLEDIHFYLSFRGQKSPPISAVAAPNAKALPRCAPSEREACREDGSSLEEIINTWFLRMGVTKGDEKAVSVHSTASTVCSRYGNPVDSTITFVGDGVEGDVETFLLETGINSLANSSQIQVIETVPGSNPYIREVQHVETFRKRLNNDSSYNESDSDLRFILRFRGERTQPLQLNASAQEMESALNALSTISGNVRVFRQSQRNGTSTWSITFAASPPTQGRLPLIERVEYFGDEEAERAEEKNARSFSVDETSIVISRVVEGLAPAWGSYALRIEQCQPNESRGRSETGLLRLDSTVDEIQAALRRLPGAFQSTFSIENNLFSEWGSLYRIENLDPGATVSIVRSQISLPVDWCETNVCSRLANLDTEMFLEVSHACSACQRDRSIPEIPLRVLIVREKVDIRGTPAAIGRALARPLFLGDSNYNSRINGASRVSWSAFLRTSQEFVANHSYYVEVDSLNDPPEIFLPSIAPIFEDTPTAIGLGIVISDPDDRDTFRQYVNVTLTAEYGTLWIPSSERVQVISGYRDGGGAGPAGLLEFRGRPADLTRVISELVYEPPTNWASKALKTDIQRVTVEIPTHHVVQTVAIGVTGSGVISGNFSLTLQCGYLNDALEEVTRKHTINVSRYPHISVQNTSVKFTVAANALASGPQVSSFEKRMQDALDACATKAIRAAATGGVQFESNSSAFEALRAVVEVSVWRSPQRAVDDGYLWEITLIKAPPQFPLLEVVRHELSGDPRGLVVTSFSGNNATSETRNPGANVVASCFHLTFLVCVCSRWPSMGEYFVYARWSARLQQSLVHAATRLRWALRDY